MTNEFQSSKSPTLIEIGNQFGNEIFFRYVYRHLSLPLLRILLKTSITPLQVTLLSILLGIVSAVLFFLADYPYLLAGAIVLNLSLVLDKVDGQLARLRNQTSAFGGWLDSVGDILALGLCFLALSLGRFYFRGHDPVILVSGIVCLFHLLMAFYVLETKQRLVKSDFREVRLGNNYIGLVTGLHVYLSLAAAFDQVHAALWVFAFLGFFAWFPVIIRHSCSGRI